MGDAPGWKSRCQHLLEFYQQSCAPGDLPDTKHLQQVPFSPGQRALCSLCPIPWPSPLRVSLPAATGGERRESSPPETSLGLLPSPGHYPEQCFSRVSLATAVLSGNSPKLTELYFSQCRINTILGCILSF